MSDVRLAQCEPSPKLGSPPFALKQVQSLMRCLFKLPR